MNPQPSWEELSPYYSATYSAYDPRHGADHDDEQHVAQARASGKLRHIPLPAGKRLLDVGCGGGFFLRIARELGAVVEGVEPNPHGAAQTRAQGIEVFQGTLDEYVVSGKARRFDLITANHVLEHVPDPVATLSRMASLLGQGGYIWVSVPNAAYPLARAIRGHWHSTDLPYHLMQFSPRSISLAGARAGLQVLDQETESIPRIVAVTIRQWLRYRWFVPRRVSQAIKWIDESCAPRVATSMDRKVSGEAILTWFAVA